MKDGVIFLLITFVLVTVGLILYVNDSIGWAQFLFVIASGTAGGGVVLIIEHNNND